MKMNEIMALVPDAAAILTEYGLHCFSCSLNVMDSLEEGCALHGFGEDILNEMIDDLNQSFHAQPEREPIVTLTDTAASAVTQLAEQEGLINCSLTIVADSNGGFCMEFCEKADPADVAFHAPSNEEVKVFVSDVVLRRIGGSTIDFRDGRFKLDLPDDIEFSNASCCGDGDCACESHTPKE